MPEEPEIPEVPVDHLEEAVRRARLELAELYDLARRAKILQRRYSTIIPQPDPPDDGGVPER